MIPTEFKEMFEKVYDKYSSLLYSIAIKLSPTPELAQQMLTKTFTEAFKLKLFSNTDKPICNELLQLLMKTACPKHKKEKVNGSALFTKTPLLLSVLNDNQKTAIDDHCTKNNLKRCEALKQLRGEFNLLRNLQLKASI